MRRHPLLAYFALTFGLTWSLGACFALFPDQLTTVFGEMSVANPLFILAVVRTRISAVIMSGLITGPAEVRQLLGGLLRWRIGTQWYVAIFVGIPMLSAIAMLLTAALARTPLGIDHWYQLFLLGPTGHHIVQAAAAGELWRVAPTILGSFLADPGPLGEELGWRGFALPRLLKGRSALSAGIILGVIWGVWHLPAFIISGTPQKSMSFPLFMIGVVALGSHDLGIQGDRWQRSRCCADSLDLQRMHRYDADAARAGLGRRSRDRGGDSGRDRRSGAFPIKGVPKRSLPSREHLIVPLQRRRSTSLGRSDEYQTERDGEIHEKSL
jgi:membrane protease YdiL (CAAX protease family)